MRWGQFLTPDPRLSSVPVSTTSSPTAARRGQIGVTCGWEWAGSQLGTTMSLCVLKLQPALSELQPRLTPAGCTRGIRRPRK